MELEQNRLTFMNNLGCHGHRWHVCSAGQGLPGPKIVELTQWEMADFTKHKQETGHNWGARKESKR